MLPLARYIQDATIPSMIIPGYAAANESLGREKAIHTLARMQNVTVLVPAFGPLLGSIIVSFVNWS